MAASSPQSDLSAKYSKLASEYAKLRAQFSVVKKAVVDEQSKVSELSESVRERDVTVRKSESEIEALLFRNQQLTRRVEVLQEEIEAIERGGKKKSSSFRNNNNKQHDSVASTQVLAASEHINSVIGQELAAKIEENARLHARLADIDRGYEDTIAALNERIRQLESSASKRAQQDRAEEAHRDDLVDGLKADNAQLRSQLEALTVELTDRGDRITALQARLEGVRGGPDVGGSPRSASAGVTGAEMRIQSVELLSQFCESVSELIAALSDFHTYWQHRIKDTHLDAPLGDTASELSQLLLQNVKKLRPLEESFQSALAQLLNKTASVTDTIGLFRPFAERLSAYIDYMREVEPLVVTCLQQESNSYSCPPSQRAKNELFSKSLRDFDASLARVADLVSSLVQGRLPPADVLSSIAVATSQWHQQALDLSKVYAAKVADENQLPTVTDQLKNTNQCISASLGSVVVGVNNLSLYLSDNMTHMKVLVSAPRSDQTSSLLSEETSTQVPVEVTKEKTEHLDPEPDSLALLREEQANLEQTISELSDKLKKAEQNKEHWKLEFQLLQIKHDKLRSGGGEDSTLREEDLLSPLRAKLDALVSEKLLADSKATSFYLECVSLQRHLESAKQRRAQMQRELTVAEEQLSIMREEMATATTNYEGQLAMMSEHVANMNDKLTRQTDEIDGLRYEVNQAKRGKK